MPLTQDVQESLKRLQNIASGYSGEDDSPETMADVREAVGAMSLKDYATLAKVGLGGVTNANVDDKTYLMEDVIKVVSDLPTKTVLSNTMTHKFLDQLWLDLQHPPQSYLGKKYAYRMPDGSANNFHAPHIGAANQPYARSIKPERMRAVARPDPGVIFDSVLKRKGFTPHPNKISSVLFYVASVIIHDCFRTDHEDFNISQTSSYLDLAPLYGSNQEQQDKMRSVDSEGNLKHDGKLKPDCFCDERILGFPPGVGLILIFFNRFHNEVVDKLAQIDEGQRFSRIRHPPIPRKNYNGEQEYSDALFNTARLITCGLYINIVLQDYVRTILNLNRTNTKWNLDPRSNQGKALFGEKIPHATGNQVSAEFNLVYRWHSTVSLRDEEWTKQQAAKIFPIPKGEEPNMKTFLRALAQWGHDIAAKDPENRPFDNLERNKETGMFNDDDMARIWTESVDDVAGSYGANRVPEILKFVEVLGINQARTWNLASLNEFRKYFKLQPHETFESINPDKEVAEQLRRLYGHPDNVEIYPGIVVESAKIPITPGSGLCTNFTTSRAILSDAVALVRGDRFYTVDYTPANLTNWGFNAAHYDVNINGGGVFYKLVLNALPNNFAKNSIYAHHPLTVPSENEKIHKELKISHLYDYKKPVKQPIIQQIKSFNAVKALFQNASKTTSISEIAPSAIVVDSKTSQRNSQVNSQTLTAMRTYLSTKPDRKYITQFFKNITADLLQKNTYDIAGIHEVDIISDVANMAVVHFAACVFALPLKTDSNPNGAFEADQLWNVLRALFTSIHTKANPAESFRAQVAAHGAVQGLGAYVVDNIKSAHPEKRGMIAYMVDYLHHHHTSDLTDQSAHMIQEMMKTGITPPDLTYNYLLPIAATIAVSLSRAFGDCLTYILPEDGKPTPLLTSVQQLVKTDSPEADAQLEGIILEALRVRTSTNLYVTAPSNIKVAEGNKTIDIAAGQTVLCDVYAANNDAAHLQDPESYNAKRGPDNYLPGIPSLPPMFPGQELGRPALVGMLKTVLKLPDLRRAVGPIGQMRVIYNRAGSKVYLTRDESKAYLYPSALNVNFGPK